MLEELPHTLVVFWREPVALLGVLDILGTAATAARGRRRKSPNGRRRGESGGEERGRGEGVWRGQGRQRGLEEGGGGGGGRRRGAAAEEGGGRAHLRGREEERRGGRWKAEWAKDCGVWNMLESIQF